MPYFERVPIRESDLSLYCENRIGRERARGLLTPQMTRRTCLVQLPRERIRRIEWQMAVREKRITQSRRDTTSAFGTEGRQVEKDFEAIRQRGAI
jgi:hypothetical protein